MYTTCNNALKCVDNYRSNSRSEICLDKLLTLTFSVLTVLKFLFKILSFKENLNFKLSFCFIIYENYLFNVSVKKQLKTNFSLTFYILIMARKK